jgi:EAL domain-containing protein (putative c-di-GMP-specific phosphodiesterase class I)/AmiR/NasT family two-component response regulator
VDGSGEGGGVSGGREASGLRFLVVEDHGFQRWHVENLLRSLGAAEVHAAEEGGRALEIVRSADPPVDVIVTDLNMPGMDGIEFIRHVGESGSRASILLVSEQDPTLLESVAAMTEAYGLGLLQALRKPLTAQKLGAAIARYRRPEALPAAAPRAFSVREIEVGLRNDEFAPYFQAKVSLATGHIEGAEALVRWRHPQLGIVLPGRFIDLLEANRKMDELTMVVLRKAAIECRAWRARGFPTTVSVNLSPTVLDDVALADRLDQVVAGQGLVPADVVLEVTENAATSHLAHILENLSRLRMKGFGLSIDDYGTGYASMQQLARIPFTELKIDQSFVRNAVNGGPSRAMLESSLEIAAKLGIPAVAEGVASEDELRLLRALGCPLGQGNYLLEPVPDAEFGLLLERRAAAGGAR